MQHSHGLRNITVCLETESAQSLHDVLAEAGIRSKASSSSSSGGGVAPSYVTLLEGVLPESNENLADRDAPLVIDQEQLLGQIDSLRMALEHHPTITVRKLHKIRRTDRTTDLLLADVTLNPAVSECLSMVVKSDNCVLPQYPCYIALGSVSREGRVSVNALKSIRRLLQGHSLELRGASLRCRPLSSSAASSPSPSPITLSGGSFGSNRCYFFASNSRRRNGMISTDPAFPYRHVAALQYGQEQTAVPQYQPSQKNRCMELSPDAAPYKLQHRSDFIRSTSNRSVGTLDTECEHTAYLSESSDSDNDGVSEDFNLSTPPLNTEVYVNGDKPMSFDSMPHLTRDAHASLGDLTSFGRSASHFAVGKNPSMDEADLACDLNFLADTPPSSPGRPGRGNVSSTAEPLAGEESIVDECRRAFQIVGM